MKHKTSAVTLPWVGYVRVSTQDQATSGLSLEAQEQKIRAMALVKGVTIGEMVIDAAESARTLDRPGVQRIMRMIRERQIAGIIINKLDRLTRSVKDLGNLVEMLQKYDVALISTAETLDTSTANGRMILNITATIAQWEREVICERTREALAAKKRRGEVAGSVTYGYRAIEGKEVWDAGEQLIIWRMEMLRERRKSFQDIADELNERSLRTRIGSRWRWQYVSRLLSASRQRLAVAA